LLGGAGEEALAAVALRLGGGVNGAKITRENRLRARSRQYCTNKNFHLNSGFEDAMRRSRFEWVVSRDEKAL
jgi:hypothetical protein